MQRLLLSMVALAVLAGCTGPKVHLAGIGDTSWQVVKFQGGDGSVVTPDDKTKYTVSFTNNGDLSVRFDCNRGRGTWILNGPSEVRFGPLAMTRVMCPPGSMHDHLVRQWPQVRSFSVRGGHLFLSLRADSGIYELERIP